MGAWGIDRPSVSGSVAAVVETTSGSERSADCGLISFDALRGVTEVAGGGLYAARPGFVKRVGWRSSYNPNAKPLATQDIWTEGARGLQLHYPLAIVNCHPSSSHRPLTNLVPAFAAAAWLEVDASHLE